MQVDGDNLVPKVGRGVDEVHELVPTGIVHQDIGRAGVLLELANCLVDGRVVGDIDA